MRTLINFLFVFILTFSANSQDLSWENLSAENDKIIFKTNAELINKKLNNVKKNTITNIKFPVDDFNFQEFLLEKDSQLKKDGKINIQLYKGISKLKKDKIFVNVIGEIITITIIQKNKRLHLSNVKNKNEFILSEIDSSDEFDNIDLENDIINHSEHDIEKKSPITNNLDPVGKTPNLIKFRMAISPTAEWSNYYIDLYDAQELSIDNKKALVTSELNIAISALNTISGRDLSILFELIPDNDKLIVFDTNLDGFTAGEKFTQLGENMTKLNNTVGFNSFDIGHVVDTGGGGVAYLSALCSSLKGGGQTGGVNGTTFHFVLAHEVGHQLGAPHTFNANVGSTTNRVETGAGVTIMGYGPRNTENLYYHAKSIKEITSTMALRNCGADAEGYSNTVPFYVTAPNSLSYTVPTGTPIVLGDDFEVSDNEESNQMLFNWDQIDGEKTVSPPINTSTVGPAFVSIFPSTDQERYLPNLETVLSGSTQNELEVIPRLSRNMNFTFTARDNKTGGGAVMQEDFNINFIRSEFGPFRVLSQNTNGLSVNQNEEIEIRWNHQASPDTDFVDIDISYDGGNSFTYNLAKKSPNDGSEKLIVPDFNKSSNARIRVKAADNIFYSINAANFTILDPSFKLNLVNPPTTKCFDETTEISIDPQGGAGAPYSVLWEKLNETNQWIEVKDLDNNPKVLTEISPGSYRVSVNDKDSNSYTSPTVIANGPKEKLKIETTFSNIKLNCFGDSNGKVEVNPTGGVFPYTLLLNNKVVTNGLKPNELYAVNDLIAGNFTLQLIDANGCLSELTNFEITQPQSKLNLKSFLIENTKSEDDGGISIEIEGGTEEYSYLWNGPNEYTSQDQNLTNLSAGNYSLKVTDASGCEFFNEFLVEQDGDFNYGLSIVNILCTGSETGKITSIPSGGSGEPFAFEWYNESDELIATKSELNNLKSGLYKLKITDSKNEDFPIKEITIVEPKDPIQLLISDIVNLNCKGDNIGKFKINISGGNAPYKYLLNGELIQSNISTNGINEKILVQENLVSGVYKIEIQDTKGCSSTVQTIISEPEYEVTLKSSEIKNISKFNLNDGSIEIEINGGTINNQESYSYSWTGPDNFSSSLKNIFNLKPGVYNLKVNDINDCFVEENFEIKSPNAFIFNSFIPNSPTCYEGNDGKINFSYKGGYGAPYRVKWTKKINSQYISIDDQTPNDNSLENITSGTYKVEVIDSESISYVYENDITVSSVNEFLIDSTSNIIAETCPGSSDGQFTVNISGGTSPYNYYFDDELIASNRGDLSNTDEYTVENLIKNEYTFYAIDANGCVTSPVTVKIDGDDPIEILNEGVAVTNISCVNGNDGKIDLIVAGGDASGNFTYQWTGPNGYSATTKNIENLSNSGTYRVTITQGNCIITKDFELIEPDELTASVTNITHSQCGSDGSYQIKISGGTAPWTVGGYSYGSAGEESTTLSFSKRSAGTYNLTVTDSNSCSSINLSAEVLGSSKAINIQTESAVACDSDIKNEIKVTLNGGDFFLDGSKEFYKVNISGPNKNEDLNLEENVQYSFKNLDDGLYTLNITERDHTSSNDSNSNGCVTKKEIYISSDVEWSGTNTTNITCVDQNSIPKNDGNKTYFNVNGGKSFIDENNQEYYKYVLDFNGTLTTGDVVKDSNLVFTDLESGSYKLTITEANNCTTEDIFEITQPSKLDTTIKKVTNACYDSQVSNQKGKVDFLIKDGTAPYNLYLIDSNNNSTDTGLEGGDSIGQNTVGWESSLDGLSPGTYSLKFIDNNNCEIISESFTVKTYDEFQTQNVVKTDISCFGASDGKLKIGSIKGGELPYKIIVESSDDFIEKVLYEESEDIIIKDLKTGSYSLKIEDNQGLCGIYLEDFEILEPYSVSISTLNTQNQTCFDYGDGLIEIEVSGGYKIGETVSYSLKWFKDDINVSSLDNLYKIENLSAGNYRVEVNAVRTVDGIEISCSSNTSSFEITRPQRLYASENLEKHIDINCNSEANGQFEIYFSGGKAPYKIISNGGVVAEGLTANTYLFSKMMAGDFKIDVLDANNCKFSESINPNTQEVYGLINIELVQPEKILEIETSFLNTSCSGSGDGEVEISVSGGKAPYNITWDTNTSYKVIESDVEKGYFKILSSSGEITATISDSTNNCGSLSSVINIKQPDELSISELSTTDNLCFEDSLGEYELYISGLTNTEALTNYSVNWYKFINNNYQLLENPNVLNSGSNFTATQLSNGDYRVSVQRKQYRNFVDGTETECSTFKDFSIASPDQLIIEETLLNNISCEREKGDFKFKIKGGKGPYNLLIGDELYKNIELNSTNEYLIENLEIGKYNIQLYDANICYSDEFNFEIKEILPNYDLIITKTDTNNNEIIEGISPTCYGGLGSFYFEIENNLSSTPLKYFLNNIEIFLDDQITLKGNGYSVNNLELKKHNFKIIDDQGACYSTEFEILNSDKIRLFDDDHSNYIVQKIFCADDQVNNSNLNKGIIDITNAVTGGKPYSDPDFDYQYEWTGPSFSSSNERIEVTEPGIYNLKIKDEAGCIIDYNFDLSIEKISSNTIITNRSCENALGKITTQPTGGKGPYSFEWYESDETGKLIKLIGTEMNISNLDVGYYTNLITDINNCIIVEEHQIINEKVHYIEEPEITDPLCLMENGYINLKLANPYNNTFDFKYNEVSLNSTITFSGLSYTEYQIELNNPVDNSSLIVSNEYGCTQSYELNLGVGIVDFDLEVNNKVLEGTIPRVAMGDEISIINKSEGKYYKIEYNLGDGSDIVSFIRDQDKTVAHIYEKEGFYVINVKIYSKQGCYKELNKTVLAGIGYSFESPNAFSPYPGSPGINDLFRPTISGFVKGLFNVYTKSGLKLYSDSFDYTNDIANKDFEKISGSYFTDEDKGWDGLNRDSSEKIFYYEFKGETFDGEEVIKSNYFTLITQ